MSDQPTARVVTVSDPAAEATAYAHRLGADVARDRDAVEQAITERMEAARLAAVAEPDDHELLGRADAIRAAAVASPVGDDELLRLRQLAGELARAERIRVHTERRVAERAAASGDEEAAPAPMVDEARRAAATAVVVAEAALHDVVTAVAVAEAAVTDAGPRPDGAPVSDDELIAAWESALDAKEAAEQDAAWARQRWHELAGPEADPRDPAAILLEVPPAEPEASPTLAAVAAFHRKIQARWRVQWAAVGGGEPPEPEHLTVAIEGLDGRRRRASGDLVRLEAAERRAHAGSVLARPLVIVEPRKWAAADDLGQLLGRLPGSAQVIVIERRNGWTS